MDFAVENHGSIVMVTPLTDAARAVDAYVEIPDWAWLGASFACEPRLVADLLAGASLDGLTVNG